MTGRGGFSAVELAICLAVSAVLVPIAYHFAAAQEDQRALGLWELRVAAEVDTISEELAFDGHRGPMQSDDVAFAEPGGVVRYAVQDGVLLRQGGSDEGARALASDVARLTPVAGGVDVVFVRALHPESMHEERVFIPVPTTAPEAP